jgi:pimeloyl-ACP methyl ester carboxylesterase
VSRHLRQLAALTADMAVHPSHVAGLRLALRVAGKTALALVGAGKLEDAAVEAIVRSPNAGQQSSKLAHGERGIAVGPPPAVLSVELSGPVSPRGTVFVLHGIRDAKQSLLGWTRMLAASGYRAVSVDLRGHGRSTGDILSYGIQESRDLVQVLDAMHEEQLVAGPVGVMGHSYGAATAIQWAARDPRVCAVIAVAPFASLREVVRGYARIPLPESFVRRALARAAARGGFDPDEASPVTAITRTRAAVLLVHGRTDMQVPAWHSERICAARPDGTELLLVDGAGHNGVAGSPRTRLAERTAALFDEYLR